MKTELPPPSLDMALFLANQPSRVAEMIDAYALAAIAADRASASRATPDSTEPKPESPAELAAERERFEAHFGAALDYRPWPQNKLDSRWYYDCTRTEYAWRGWLAALSTIQASASASQEPVARERGKEWHAALSAAGAYAESCRGLMATPSTNAWMALQQALDILAATQARPVSGEAVTVTVEEMVESVNGVSWWVVLRRGKERQDDGKYGAAFKNRAEWHAAGLRWILGQGEKPNIHDYMDAAPTPTPSAED